MYSTIRRLYLAGKISESGLNKAVSKGWITSEQKDKILSLK